MHVRSTGFAFTASLIVITGLRAQTDTPRSTASTVPARATNNRAPAKGPLPDPVLLDGSNQPAEKHPDYGMLGQFEIPGDANAKGDKVGGQQNPNQHQGGGGGQQQQNQAQNGGMSGGIPQGGASGGPQSQSGQTAQQGGGGAAGGAQQQNQNAQGSGGASGQPGDPNAKAEGIQVAGLDGEAAAGAAGAGGSGDNVPKPQQVAIGDKASQITPVANAPGVVGQAVVANSTQQMESKIGKGAGAGPSGGNGGGKGIEKGRTMPDGL